MKRGAERELNKDNADDIEESEDTPTEGLRKADESVLATRVIRGLPKRTSSIITTQQRSAPTDEKDTDASNFGFSSNKTFSFTTSQNNISKSTSPNPVVSSSASTTAKSFASFLSPSSSSSFKSSNSQQKTSALPSSTEAPNVDDPALYKYYTSLRGLNVSLLDVLLETTEKNPFADISDLLDRYKSLRLDIQKEYDKQPSELNPASMPTPPAKFTGFGSSAVESSGDIGQSQPKPTPSSPFTFTPPPASSPFATSAPSTSTFSFLPTSNADSLRTGESKPRETSSFVGGTPSWPSFAFGVPSAVTSDGIASSQKPFFSAPVTDASKSPPDAVTAEKSIALGAPPAEKSTSVFNAGPPTTNPFGSNGRSLFATPPTSSQTNSGSFGSFGDFGSFSGTGGNIGNPVGFGFGSPSLHDDDSKGDDKGTVTDAQESQDAASNESPSALLTKNPHDEEGEGEEEEDTVHAVKVKAFVLRKSKDKEVPAWVDLGQGILRLKRHKESAARRILLRNSNTGKINLNFYIYSGFKPTQNKKTLTFVGHDESKTSQTYSVRLQDEQQASALKENLEKEAAATNAKSND